MLKEIYIKIKKVKFTKLISRYKKCRKENKTMRAIIKEYNINTRKHNNNITKNI